MNVLAFETATGRPGVCLKVGADGSYVWLGARRPSPSVVTAAAEGLLKDAGLAAADLDCVACGRGPGAFTGVRLGIALAQGFALGAGCSAVGVSDLLALAWKARRERGWARVMAVLDARQEEVYQAAYDFSRPRRRECVKESLARPASVRLPEGEWAVVGSGAALIDVASASDVDAALEPDAATVAELAMQAFAAGKAVTAADLSPVYLRHRVATPKSGS